MTYKERLAKRKTLFSVTSYLKNKAVRRAEKLTYRAAKRDGTLPQAEPELHVHEDDCEHEHTEE